MKRYLLIDIGGTYIKYCLADEMARPLESGKVPTPMQSLDALLDAIAGFAAPYQGTLEGCAISMPGRIDTRTGIAHTGGMLSGYMWEQPFAAQVSERLGVPVTIANDGKCAAAAEAWTGALADVENGLVVVLGTGIGGGISAAEGLLPLIRQELDGLFERCPILPMIPPELVRCRYGNDANMIGALKLFFEHAGQALPAPVNEMR